MRDKGNKRSRGERAVMGRTRVRTHCMCQIMRKATSMKQLQFQKSFRSQEAERCRLEQLMVVMGEITSRGAVGDDWKRMGRKVHVMYLGHRRCLALLFSSVLLVFDRLSCTTARTAKHECTM